MQKAKYVYVVYINTTPEKVWDAIGDPEMTRQYWGNARNVSDWKPGSRWHHEDLEDPKHVKMVGKVLESSRPKRLVISWANPADEGNAAKTSRVTFEIETFMESVKLTVIHDELEQDSEMHKGIMGGWPIVLSSLKTLLETGEPLAMTTSNKWGTCKQHVAAAIKA